MTTTQPLRVLIVEDDPGIRDLLTIAFEEDGWAVSVAADGDEAASKVAVSRPDVIVLDLMMPRKSGFALLQQWKSDRSVSEEQIVVLTAVPEEKLRHLMSYLGVYRVISKPFDIENLLQICKGVAVARSRRW